jgi:hypothetical protein
MSYPTGTLYHLKPDGYNYGFEFLLVGTFTKDTACPRGYVAGGMLVLRVGHNHGAI